MRRSTWSTVTSNCRLRNGHYSERCFLPTYIYDTATGRPVAMLLRTGTIPSGTEMASQIRRLIRRIRRHWPFAMLELELDLGTQGKYLSPVLLSLGWERRWKWVGKAH